MTRLVSGIIRIGCAPKDLIMLIDHSREKLLNAINFFARNTENLGKIKLFKLLYLLDFEHFRQTGRSVTGLEYRAWKLGPVPILLMQEWEQPEPDFLESLRIEPERVFDHVRHSVRPLAEFDDRHFSRRELRLMEHLATEYRDTLSQHMIDRTHAVGQPWAKVWHEQGMDAPIPYSLAINENSPEAEAILEAAREYEAMLKADRGRNAGTAN